MKNIINFIVIMFLIATVLAVYITDDIDADINKLKPYNGWIVTDKNHDFVFGNTVKIRKSNTESHIFMCEDIVFESLTIGETITVF